MRVEKKKQLVKIPIQPKTEIAQVVPNPREEFLKWCNANRIVARPFMFMIPAAPIPVLQ